MTKPLVHICLETGHLPSYQAVFLRLLNGKPSTGRLKGDVFWSLVKAKSVFFCTIDTDYRGFLGVALLRAMVGKKTTGLFLRPMQCFRSERPVVYALKKWLFRTLKWLPGLRLLAIIPYDIEPKLRQVTHDWIHDPQLWDLWLDGPPDLPDTELSRRVEEKRDGRQVMIFVGQGNRIKGYDKFVESSLAAREEVLAVSAGRVSPEFSTQARALAQAEMIVVDRFVSDEEILSLYKVANKAWCCYAPDYDQASGIFGRAIQTDVGPIFRKGSLLEKYACYFDNSLKSRGREVHLGDIQRKLISEASSKIDGINEKN